MNAKQWFRNIGATVINGFASGVILIIADPADFNFENPKRLLMTSAAFAVLGLANFLKQNPLPDDTVSVRDR